MDKYDEAVEYLRENPELIYDRWNYPMREHGVLFGYVSPKRDEMYPDPGSKICGCLTQVKAHVHDAYTATLTEAIRQDARIPEDAADLTEDHLEVFAEWQRRIDRELGREPPE